MPSSPSFRLAIFASGNGSNAEAIIRYFEHHPAIQVSLVLTNNPKAFVLERAQRLNVQSRIFTREEFAVKTTVIDFLRSERITHIVLAGFLWLIPENLVREYSDRIINIHPSLLPKFGGHGMYGMKVHEAVRNSGEAETGITIHLVNNRYDEGRILFQKSCAVEKNHTPQEIAACVQQLEYENYPVVIEKWILSQ